MAKYLIVGGVAGGATAAARLRRIDENSEIIMFERGKNISYANCGLPYYIGDVITEREKLLVQTPQSFTQRFNVDVRAENEVVSIDREKKTVLVKNLATGENYSEEYDKLILSPGAEPVRPPLPGIDSPNIFTLRNVHDTDTIKTFIDKTKPTRALVVGAGFIGLEMAENLHHRGIKVTIVEMADQVMTPLDYEMAAEVHQHLKMKSVELLLNEAVASFTQQDSRVTVRLKSGRSLCVDMVILSIGVRPENTLAKDSGLEIGKRGGIVVNQYMQTTDPNIYALGDAIEFPHPIIGVSMPTYLAGPANKQGRIVADNIVRGNRREYKGAIGTAIAKVFDITVAACGIAEKILKKENLPYLSSITHGSSHAGYYPGALPLTLKIMFHPETGTLYGAQIVGYEGVDKRIDLIATVLQHKGTIYDLEEIEHAYAPPFSSAKDPVNIAGFVAENMINKTTPTIQWHDLLEVNRKEWCLIDVRTEEEYSLGTIDGAINMPVDNIRSRFNEIPKDKNILIFCGVGLRGHVALRIIMQLGIKNVYNLSGGYKTFEHATQKQSNEDIFENDEIRNDDLIYQINSKSAQPESTTTTAIKTVEVDACGLQCPGPIMKLKQEVDKLKPGERLRQIATDQGFYKDVASWCSVTGNQLVSVNLEKGKVVAVVEKGAAANQSTKIEVQVQNDGKTIVVFSDDLDRALASLVIANGAAAMGKKVTLFFTFWGLNVIKNHNAPKVKKDFMGKMFGTMMPRSAKKLKLSKMNMGGLGTMMMGVRMSSKKVDSVAQMLDAAVSNGVELMACQMSMDIMGITEQELRPGVTIGGVATYLAEAEKSNINLFI